MNSKKIKQSVILLALFLLLFISFNSYSEFDYYSHIVVGKKDEMLRVNESLYETLQLQKKGLSQRAFDYAVQGYQYLRNQHLIQNEKTLTIIDFSLPSFKKRLFVIDLMQSKLLFNTYVAHGINSGFTAANSFSNAVSSFKSSIGFYKTLNTYNGKNGYSLQLHGLEIGVNDQAEMRAIVLHGAPYVSEHFILEHGFLGRSWGCPAVPPNLARPIIDEIKNGSCLFVYADNTSYLNQSTIIQ